MERYTRKDAERQFARLCELLGKRIATSYDDVGGWTLDHAAAYGGFQVQEICGASGGISLPMGEGRLSAREFCQSVHFAARALATQGATR